MKGACEAVYGTNVVSMERPGWRVCIWAGRDATGTDMGGV